MKKDVLELFITTADAGSFEQASQQLFLSPPALMKQINNLERETKLKLFYRTNKGIVLTSSGKIFYNSLSKIIKDYQDAVQLARDTEKVQSETLRLGISLINPYKDVADKFHYRTRFYNETYITVVPLECNYKAFADQFTNMGQEVDAIPYFLGNQDLDLICQSYCLARVPFRIAVPSKHRLFSKTRLTYADLENETILTINGNLNTYYHEVQQAISEHAPTASFSPVTFIDFAVFDDALRNNRLLLVGDYLKGVHPSFRFLPMEWNFNLPYGLYFSQAPSKLLSDLLEIFAEIGKTGKIEETEIIEF